MLWKCYTQYASKFGKLSSDHRTWKGQFSFQSQRKAMPKNAQTTVQLHSSHTLVKWCLKFSKPGFSNMWTMNFQMFKLVLEKAEEPETKLPTSAESSTNQHDWVTRLNWYPAKLVFFFVFKESICLVIDAVSIPIGQKDTLDEKITTHSSILAWKIPEGATVHGVPKSRTQLSLHVCINADKIQNVCKGMTALWLFRYADGS